MSFRLFVPNSVEEVDQFLYDSFVNLYMESHYIKMDKYTYNTYHTHLKPYR